MNKLKKSLLILFAVFLVLSIPFSAFADGYSYKPYYFSKYDVEINVTEDNILQVTENIDAYFNQKRHGIYRNIPISNNVKRADGTSGTTHAKISNVRCSDDYSASYKNGDYVIQIGDKDKTITGSHHYRISYDYKLGKDILDGADELYYNIIGDGWDTYIQNVTFKITMPKEFDQSKLGFSTGEYGTVGTNDIIYYVNGNEINGSIAKDLAPNEALTVRLELPEGYFYFDQSAHMVRLGLMVGIPVICLLFVVIIWYKFGRDKKVEKIVEFYPPDGMSSADVAFWKQGVVNDKDAVPLLIELANEGYIKIYDSDNSDRSYGNDDNYVIERIKTYDGPDENKKIFFNGLFESGKTKVKGSDLKDKFYLHLLKIHLNYNAPNMTKMIFNVKSLRMRFLCWVAVVICFGINILILRGTLGTADKICSFAFGTVILAASFIISFFVRQRTELGYINLQKIEGFKMFLETAEKEKLETLVEDNPEYFYNILPYAYVLGISDKWIKQFENIAVAAPDWYCGSGDFSVHGMYHFMNSTVKSCSDAMTSAPQSSSGGGGFSGGGSGGGGGGSW